MHERKPMRLKGVDYSQPGYYFVTIRIHNDLSQNGFSFCDKSCTDIFEGIHYKCNEYGEIVTDVWTKLPQHYPNCELDEHIIMPDHFHGIIHITMQMPETPLSEIIRGFKTFSSRKINDSARNGLKPFPTTSQSPFPTTSPTTSQSPFPTTSATTSQSPFPTTSATTSQSPFPTTSPTTSQSPFPTTSPTTSQSPFPTSSATTSQSPFPTTSPTTSQSSFPTSSHSVRNGLKPFPTSSATTSQSPFRWQKSYYERIIRNDAELNIIREYIKNNPQQLTKI